MVTRRIPEVLDSRTVAESRLFRIEERRLLFSNGVAANFERLTTRAHGAVLVVPMRDAQTVLLIREYAAGLHRYELALPKGIINEGETALQAANRELMEETGHGARNLSLLTTLSVAPGYLNHRTNIVLAEDLYEQRLPGDEPEEIEVVPWPLADIRSLVAREDCSEARSIAALFIVRELLHEAS